MLRAVKETSAWRLARGLKRGLLPPRCDADLPGGECQSVVTLSGVPAAVEVKQPFPLTVRVEHRSGAAWTATGAKPVSIGWHWRTCRGERFTDGPAGSIPLPRPVFPGEPQSFELPVTAPAFVGDFTLAVDLEQTGRPFADRCPDAAAAEVTIPVQGSRSTDIDYHAVYRTANLDENHWWPVGAYHTKEQYEQSAKDRVSMLAKYGLTTDGRLLDVGCGTGQLAGPLMGYLSEKGAYYGTDIGKEAVAFCNRTFRRRGFVFRQGGMTTLPFDAADGPFDMAVFFSVFTHTFPDETALLLAETVRLLKPGGRVVCDVITSPLVERGCGHRGEMVLNRDHFERLAGIVGLSGDVIGSWAWNPHATRFMYVFRRADGA